jgi:hypothetical protein
MVKIGSAQFTLRILATVGHMTLASAASPVTLRWFQSEL